MILLDHSTYDQATIAKNLGAPEYSYWFVRKAFRAVLGRFGVVVPVADVEKDADTIYRSARANGTDCVLFSFNPPQYAPVGLECPVVPVFAWEFDRIPDESWNENPLEDWRVPLGRVAAAITHSSDAVAAVRRTMGADCAIWSIPAPMADPARRHRPARAVQDRAVVALDGGIAIDVSRIDMALFRGGRAFSDGQRAIGLLRRLAADPDRPTQTISFDGVVYTAVFNPVDGRKNWDDMTAAFVWAFRHRRDATLVIKVTHADIVEAVVQLLEHIGKLGPFSCRIVVIHGLLSDASYSALIEATSYCVNTSQGEGQCLPLMEFMAAGRPAVAPLHTAMHDYVRPENSFVVPTFRRPGFWPHDERQATRCLRHDIVFDGLVRAFRESFRVARETPSRYGAMAAAAIESLDAYCSDAVVERRLAEVFDHLGFARAAGAPATATRPEPLDPYYMGLHDSVLSGWYDKDTGELARGFPVTAADIVADIGCGDGGPIEFCARQGASLILCDADGERLAGTLGRVRTMTPGTVEGHVADAAALPLADGAATRVVCMEVLEHVEDPDRVMAELVRIVRPGGLVLVSVPGAQSEHIMELVGPPSMFEPPNHIRIFEPGQLRALVERGGLTVEIDDAYGFYWSMLLAIFWQTGVPLGQSDPLLASWARFWSDMLAGRDGRKIKRAFDGLIPRVQMIIARKPG